MGKVPTFPFYQQKTFMAAKNVKIGGGGNLRKQGSLGKSKDVWREVKRRFLRMTIDQCYRRYPLKPVELSLYRQPDYRQSDLSPAPILQELRSLNGFTFLPNFGNMGDIVITMATRQLFQKSGLSWEMFRPYSLPSENLVFGGGGLFVRDWQIGYRHVLKLFQGNGLKRIVILPSSFHDCPDLLDIVDARFTIFCREKRSYDYLLSAGTRGNIILSHDMVFFLAGGFPKTDSLFHPEFRRVYRQIIASVPRLTKLGGYSVGFFLRSDSESANPGEKAGLLSTLDLSTCICSSSRNMGEVAFYSKLFFAGIDTADIVVTDRLHVGICAMLLGKEVFLLDNSYGKVSGVYEQSMRRCSRVHFVDDAEELPDVIGGVIAGGNVRRTANLESMKKIGESLQHYEGSLFSKIINMVRTFLVGGDVLRQGESVPLPHFDEVRV